MWSLTSSLPAQRGEGVDELEQAGPGRGFGDDDVQEPLLGAVPTAPALADVRLQLVPDVARSRVPGPCTACGLRLALYSVIVPTTRGDGQTWGMGANAVAATSVYLDRIERVRSLMAERGVDVLLLSVGHDLPYLTGYLAMPLERLTMLVLPQDGDATLVVPRLEAPRVVEQPGVFSLRPWSETEDPVAIVADLAGRPGTAAVGDQTWARFLVDLLPRLPDDRVPARRRDRRSAAGAQGRRRRSPRSPPPARRPTASRRSCRAATSRCSAAPRRRCRPTSRSGSSPRATTR